MNKARKTKKGKTTTSMVTKSPPHFVSRPSHKNRGLSLLLGVDWEDDG